MQAENYSNPNSCEIILPEKQLYPFVYNSPHSGRYYPQSFLDSSILDAHRIRMSEDFLVDQLFSAVVAEGAPLVAANYARAFLDVNREPYELDPKMFDDKLPDFVNTSSLRVAGGLGTIARNVSERHEIYRGKLDVSEVFKRIDHIYKPYHDKLRNIMAKTHMGFGYAIIMDCHSMPSAKNHNKKDIRADFVLGDRYGSSAGGDLVNSAKQILTALGYNVAVNRPYAGGFITEHYGRPKDGLHALQIEINRGIYMDEDGMQIGADFYLIQSDIAEFSRQIMALTHHELESQFRLAAE